MIHILIPAGLTAPVPLLLLYERIRNDFFSANKLIKSIWI